MITISTEMAFRLRFVRKILLPIDDNANYQNPEVGEIALRQRDLMAEMERLDERLIEIYQIDKNSIF